MKIAYNPKTAAALATAPANNDITFDLSGLSIYVKGVRFKGTDTTYSVFKKHGSSGGGYDGLVPVPNYNGNSLNRYLKEDGTWLYAIDVQLSEATNTDFRPVVLGLTHSATLTELVNPVTGQVYITSKIYACPSTGILYATKLYSNGKEVLTEHQSLSNYVTLNTTQSITGTKTFTNPINNSYSTNTYLAGNLGKALINSTATAGSYVMLFKGNSTSGYFTHGVYLTKYLLQYTTKSTVTEGTNSITKSAVLLDESGDSLFPGNITALKFIGKIDWNNIEGKPSCFTPCSHTHSTALVTTLTSYTKATSNSALSTSDSLNLALGKLEYKGDLGVTAYSLINAAYDGDGTIENLKEILKVLEGIKDTDTIKGLLGKYLPLSGGTMTGPIKFNGDTSLPSKTLSYVCGVDTFASGGEMGYMSGSSFVSQYAPTKTGTGASGTWGISITGNATTAAKLQTARTITLTGSVTGSVSFNGSGDVTLATTTNHIHLYLNTFNTIGSNSQTHAEALQNEFNNNKNSIPKDKLITYYSNSYGYGSLYFGYFLHGHNDNPYGGFFVANYDTPYYIGIANGNYKLHTLLHESNYSNYAPSLTGSGASGTWNISISGNAATATNADKIDKYHVSNLIGGVAQANHGSQGTEYTPDTYSSTFVDKSFAAYAERGSWSYANNGYISTDLNLNIPLAGTAIFQWGASDTNKTQLYITPGNHSVTNGVVNEMLFYSSNGNDYAKTWTRVLTHRNYNSFAPTLTGRGASGTWGISISGTAKRLANYYSGRPSSANIAPLGDGGMIKFIASSSMTTGKPTYEGHIIHLFWDSTSGWDSQLSIPATSNSSAEPQFRQCNNGTWGDWINLITSNTIGSYNVGSATNADMLDGFHEGSFYRSVMDVVDGETALSNIPANRSGSYILLHSGWNGAAHIFYAGSSNSTFGFMLPGGTNEVVKVISAVDSTASTWKILGELAYLNSNVASATKLQTARTIWGHSFDGTADIPTSYVATMPYVLFKNYNDNNTAGFVGRGSTVSNDIHLRAYSGNALSLGANGSNALWINTSNNIGIGTDSPETKLHVVGGQIKCNYSIFGHRYNTNTNAAAFIWDKPGSYQSGVGSDGTTDTIRFSACDTNGAWVSYTQNWKFYGNVYATETVTATTFKGSLEGNASTANKSEFVNLVDSSSATNLLMSDAGGYTTVKRLTGTVGEYDNPIYISNGIPTAVSSIKLKLYGFMFGYLTLPLDSITLTGQQVRLNQLFIVGSGKTVKLPTPSDSLVGMVLFFKSATGSSYSISCESTNKLVLYNKPMSTTSNTISLSSNGSAIFVCMKYGANPLWVLFWCG